MNDLTPCVVLWKDRSGKSEYTEVLSKRDAEETAMRCAARGCYAIVYTLTLYKTWGERR